MKNKNEDFKSDLESQYNTLILASRKEQKSHSLIIIFLLIITLITSILSLILSFNTLSHTKKITEQVKTTDLVYKTLEVTYSDDQYINIENLKEGFHLEEPKSITITNTGDSKITFDIKISSIKTSLESTSDLIYTITKVGGYPTQKSVPLSETPIVINESLGKDETVTYNFNIEYKGSIPNPDKLNYYFANIVVNLNENQILK